MFRRVHIAHAVHENTLRSLDETIQMSPQGRIHLSVETIVVLADSNEDNTSDPNWCCFEMAKLLACASNYLSPIDATSYEWYKSLQVFTKHLVNLRHERRRHPAMGKLLVCANKRHETTHVWLKNKYKVPDTLAPANERRAKRKSAGNYRAS